jgi:phosphoenolpyruvate carboxylase
VTGNEWPLANRRVLGRAVQLRSPYVDALSLLQVRALRALRSKGVSEGLTVDDGEWVDGGHKDRWQHLLLLTVNGVSAGLQNTG